MNIKFLLPFLLLSIISLRADSQKFENAFLQPGTEVAKDVAELPDGSIITVGYANGIGNGGYDLTVMKTSASGAVLWSRNFGGAGDDFGNAVVISPQKEIYVAGYTTAGADKDGFLVKLNAGGGVIWTKTFGAGTVDEIRDIGFKGSRLYGVGVTNGAGAGGNDIWLLKTDTSGTVIQNKTLGTSAADEANAMTFTNDGNIALTGQSMGYWPASVFLAKINLSCDTLWTRKYDLNLTTSSSGIIARGIAQLTTNELVITGRGYDVGNYPSSFHVKVDLSGNTVFTKWTSFLSDEGYDVVAGKNGTYYLLAEVCNFGCRAYIVKYDNAGNQLLATQYGYPGTGSYASFTTAYRLYRNVSSKLFLSGASHLNAYNDDVLLARLDSNGVGNTNSAPVITATGPVNFCQGAATKLVAPAGYDFYCWARMYSGNMLFVKVNNDTISPTSTGAYYCICWTGNSYRISNVINITVSAAPSSGVTASGSLAFCAASGDSVIFTAATGYSYQWQLNAVNIPGATSNTYVAKSSGSYAVNITNSCGSTSSALMQVNANSISTPNIYCTGDCFSGSGLCYPPGYLTAVATSTGTITDYRWYVDGVPYGPGGPGAINVVPPYPQGNYTCTVSNACGSATSSVYQVQSGPLSGPSGNEIHLTQSAGCGLGSNITLQAPIGSGAPYQWFLNGSPISGATNYWYIALQSGNYSLSYYDPYCMSGNTTPLLPVTLNTPNPILSAPNGGTNCSGAVLLSVSPSTAGMQFEWFKDDLSLGPVGSNAVFSATLSGVYKCRVYNPVCGWDITNTITVSTGASTPVITNTGSVICSPGTAQFICSPSSNSFTYQWYRNGNSIAGANLYSYTTGIAGTYYCMVTNACGALVSNSSALSVLPGPIALISPPASLVICTPQSLLLSAVPVSGASYQWYNGSSAINGAVDSVYAATSAGNYSVRVKQGACTSWSSTEVLTASSGVTAAVTTSGYPQICSGESFTMTATNSAAYTYQWRKNGVNIAGATSHTYSTSTAGTYDVVVTNACNSLTVSGANLIVKNKPSAALTALGPVSFCAGDSVEIQTANGTGYTYNWKRNGSIIPGATSSSYMAKLQGAYKALVYSQYGCLKESGALNISVPCRSGDVMYSHPDFTFDLFPNPASGTATLTVYGAEDMRQLEIYARDITGRFVDMDIKILQDRMELTPPLPGVYLITVIAGDKSASKRLLRIN